MRSRNIFLPFLILFAAACSPAVESISAAQTPESVQTPLATATALPQLTFTSTISPTTIPSSTDTPTQIPSYTPTFILPRQRSPLSRRPLYTPSVPQLICQLFPSSPSSTRLEPLSRIGMILQSCLRQRMGRSLA
jgi:hypothetical protein